MVCYALIKMNEPVPPAQIWKDLAVHHSRLGSILEDILLVPLPNVAVREVLLGLKPATLGVFPGEFAPHQSRLLNID